MREKTIEGTLAMMTTIGRSILPMHSPDSHDLITSVFSFTPNHMGVLFACRSFDDNASPLPVYLTHPCLISNDRLANIGAPGNDFDKSALGRLRIPRGFVGTEPT